MRLSDIASLGIAAAQDVMSSAGESTAESNLYMKIHTISLLRRFFHMQKAKIHCYILFCY